jgi:O-methyltransferase
VRRLAVTLWSVNISVLAPLGVRFGPARPRIICAVDWTIYRDSKIGRLPTVLRPAGLLARNAADAVVRRHNPYPYEADGLATRRFSPFLDDGDREFNAVYDKVIRNWYPADAVDIRWRAWLLTRFARQFGGFPSDAPANFAEFGTYRAGCAELILSTVRFAGPQRFFLFDTFEGIPRDERLTADERHGFYVDRYRSTSVEYVERVLAPWRDRIEICPGDVFETLERTETGPLAWVHLDLNASAPTVRALEYAYTRVVPGGLILFDDYGDLVFADQRRAIDAFLAEVPEEAIALPTGQAIVIKR